MVSMKMPETFGFVMAMSLLLIRKWFHVSSEVPSDDSKSCAEDSLSEGTALV